MNNNIDTPGPGAYMNKDKTQGPNFGFGTGKRGEAKMSTTSGGPGPGAYDSKSSLTGIAASMKDRRPMSATTDMLSPGPGAYNLKSAATTISVRIGNSERQTRSKGLDVPGPGTYKSNNPCYVAPK